MSFFRDLFSKKITYVEYFRSDRNYPELIHVFGARRIMPDEGDSFDIWRHCVVNAMDFSVTVGIEQRGNEFSINSGFAKRALEEMAKKMNRNLAFAAEKNEDDDDDEPVTPKRSTVKFYLRDSNDTDTAELPKTPKDGVVLTTFKTEVREGFSVQPYSKGLPLQSHTLTGMCDYFRHAIFYPERNQLIVTYRKEKMGGTNGGMAFYVLDMNDGALLCDKFIA